MKMLESRGIATWLLMAALAGTLPACGGGGGSSSTVSATSGGSGSGDGPTGGSSSDPGSSLGSGSGASSNTAPVADAGANQSVAAGSPVTLSGAASHDADGDALTYRWTLSTRPAGSTSSLSNSNSAAPSFTPDVAGTYIAQLVVNDGKANSATATITVTATSETSSGTQGTGLDASWTLYGASSQETGPIRSLAAIGDTIIAGGDFAHMGAADAIEIAKLNGGSWSSMTGIAGAGLNETVYALAVDSHGILYAGGTFTQTMDGIAVPGIARWDGQHWSAITRSIVDGSGLTPGNASVRVLRVMADGRLIAGGMFASIDGVAARDIAAWDGSHWSPLGHGLGGYRGTYQHVLALASASNGRLFAGGLFTGNSSDYGSPNCAIDACGGVAYYDGTDWTMLPFNAGAVRALAFDTSDNLYVGGEFTSVSVFTGQHLGDLHSLDATGVFEYSGTAFSGGTPCGTITDPVTGVTTPIGTCTDASSSPLVSRLGQSLLRTDCGLPSPCNGSVNALAIDKQGHLVVGGVFTSVDSIPAVSLARWDGSHWSAIGSGDILRTRTGISAVYSLMVDSNGALWAGFEIDDFLKLGGNAELARWTGD